MHVTGKVWKPVSATLLAVGGAFFICIALLSSIMLTSNNEFATPLFKTLIIPFILLETLIGSLLLAIAYGEFRTPRPRLLWIAFGLISGICIGKFVSQIILLRQPILQELAPAFSTKLLWDGFLSSVISLLLFTLWFAVPLWRHRPSAKMLS